MSNLQIRYQEKYIDLNHFEYSKPDKELRQVSESDSSIFLKVGVPFEISKSNDALFQPENDIDRILLLRNRYFGELNMIKLKYRIEEDNKTVGFIFSLRALLSGELFREDRRFVPYGLRSLVMLINNRTSLSAKKVEFRNDSDYELQDFYEDDLIICAISKQLLPGYSDKQEEAILFKLHLFGFYLVGDSYRAFQPLKNDLQQQNYNDCLDDKGEGTICVRDLSPIVNNEPYFGKYIKSLINQPNPFINRFLLSYQCVEILIDYVTKKEISERVCGLDFSGDIKGHKIQNLVYEISTEAYRVRKLIEHYSSVNTDVDFFISYNVSEFLENLNERFKEKDRKLSEWFYVLRNQLVHNLRLFYNGDDSVIYSNETELNLITNQVEYLVSEVINSLEL
nr:hypothetical protein [uncultured Draconibacterium sp.]